MWLDNEPFALMQITATRAEAWGYLDYRPDHPERLALFTADGKLQCTFAADETEADIAGRLAPTYRVRDRLVFKA